MLWKILKAQENILKENQMIWIYELLYTMLYTEQLQ